MGLTSQSGRLHCSTSECTFGPQCDNDDEADRLAEHVQRTRGKDARELNFGELTIALLELRTTTPYRVAFGYQEWGTARFATWPEALKFARAQRARKAHDPKYFVRVYNDSLAQLDSYGLTAEQQAELDAPLEPAAEVVGAPDAVVDLFGALKDALGKGQASTL